jgi:hypothetical protein
VPNHKTISTLLTKVNVGVPVLLIVTSLPLCPGGNKWTKVASVVEVIATPTTTVPVFPFLVLQIKVVGVAFVSLLSSQVPSFPVLTLIGLEILTVYIPRTGRVVLGVKLELRVLDGVVIEPADKLAPNVSICRVLFATTWTVPVDALIAPANPTATAMFGLSGRVLVRRPDIVADK